MSKRLCSQIKIEIVKEADRLASLGITTKLPDELRKLFPELSDKEARDVAFNVLIVRASIKRGYMNPVRIPEKVLAWRERQRKGSIMRPATFRGIKRKAARGGYRIPSAVGGKAYWVTTLRKYLDKFPGDKTAIRTLRRLLGIRGIKSSSRRPRRPLLPGRLRRRNPRRLRPIKERASYYKWYAGGLRGTDLKFKIFTSRVKPTKKLYGDKFWHVFGPFGSRKEVDRWVRK